MPSAEPPAVSTEELGGGPGRLIVALYAVLALAASGRSILQITEYFERARMAYLLSALAALIYLVATYALARGRRTLAAVTITSELLGSGYGYVPLVLPVLGLWWLRRSRVSAVPARTAG